MTIDAPSKRLSTRRTAFGVGVVLVVSGVTALAVLIPRAWSEHHPTGKFPPLLCGYTSSLGAPGDETFTVNVESTLSGELTAQKAQEKTIELLRCAVHDRGRGTFGLTLPPAFPDASTVKVTVKGEFVNEYGKPMYSDIVFSGTYPRDVFTRIDYANIPPHLVWCLAQEAQQRTIPGDPTTPSDGTC